MADVVRTTMDCNGCKKEREKKDETPRPLFRLPDEITRHKMFKRQTLPIYMCLHCDGDAIEDALREHDRRTGS